MEKISAVTQARGNGATTYLDIGFFWSNQQVGEGSQLVRRGLLGGQIAQGGSDLHRQDSEQGLRAIRLQATAL